MIGLLLFVVLPLVCIAAAIVVVGVRNQRRSAGPDIVRRVGDETSVDASDAAKSAGGRAAWMRGDF